jgi:hypothetical protein
LPTQSGGTEGSHLPDERLRFQEFGFQRLPNGRCRAKVVLTWSDGRRFEGSADGVSSQTGELRCCAVAAVNALEQAVQPRLTFELLGVKTVRAFDATVVIVSLTARAEQTTRLIGSCLTETDPARGAALAVLNATNRLLGNYLATR